MLHVEHALTMQRQTIRCNLELKTQPNQILVTLLLEQNCDEFFSTLENAACRISALRAVPNNTV